MADPVPPIQQMPWWKVFVKILVAVIINEAGALIIDHSGFNFTTAKGLEHLAEMFGVILVAKEWSYFGPIIKSWSSDVPTPPYK